MFKQIILRYETNALPTEPTSQILDWMREGYENEICDVDGFILLGSVDIGG